jgi:putative membrane protein (TIGR04086 family)
MRLYPIRNERGDPMEPIKNVTDVRFSSPLFSGLVYAFLTMGSASLIYSFVLAFTAQTEDSLSFFVYFIHAVSIFIGAYSSGKRSSNKGWYHGGILGVIYGLIIIIVGFLSFDYGFSLQSLLVMMAAFFLGAFGGILGVNRSK